MKRRDFLVTAFGGLGLALGAHRLSAQAPLICQNDADVVSQSAPLLSFAAVGDVGTGNRGQDAVAQAMRRYFDANPFSLVLLAGDNIYENGDIKNVGGAFERPYRFFRRKNLPFYAVLGNHDIRTNNGWDEVRYRGFNMQGRYYSFTKGTVQFLALDTNKNASWSEQLVWLEENLARSQAPWKVVFGHHPVYSSGMHGNTPQLAEKLTPLFSRYGVQLYINGHDHNYERTKPIEGTTYLTCGAGAKLRPVGSSDWTADSVSRLSFAAIAVFSDRLEIRGIGTDGRVFDCGIIQSISQAA